MELTGKVALVTGSSGSLGKGIAVGLAKAGADVACHYFKRSDVAEDLVKTIREMGHKAIAVQGDLTDPIQANRVVEETVSKLGILHILVNNAGVNHECLFLRENPDKIHELILGNLESMIYVSHAAAKVMAKNRWGRMIHMGSVTAHVGSLGQVAYASSKAGIEGMSRGLARELGRRGITSNVIAPGMIKSGMTEKMHEDARNEFAKLIAVGRTGTVEEVASAVVFIASDGAGYITGSVLHVNGGIFMQ